MDSPAQISEDFGRLRRLLVQAITASCPRWLAEERDDMVQRALVRIVQIANRRAAGDGFSASYLNRVAFTVVADEISRWKRTHSYPIQVLPDGEPRATNPNPEEGHRLQEFGWAIRRCLEGLHPTRRRAVTLMLLGHKNREIALLMKWDAKRAENLVTRGRADLRRCLEERGFRP